MEDIANEQKDNNDGVIMVKQESIPKIIEDEEKEGAPVPVPDGDASPRSEGSSKKSKE